MSHHLVLGAGGIGRATTTRLTELGHTVTLVSRSGKVGNRPWEVTSPGAVEVVAADATRADDLIALAGGATSIVNAINPPKYTTWARDWPPVAEAILTAAERTGAGVVTVSNLYGYGPVSQPMTEATPLAPRGVKGQLRADMWREAKARHDAGRLRATELRASDYFGPESSKGTSVLNDFVLAKAAAGSRVVMPMGDVDAEHSWTYLPDIGALAAVLATDDRSWGEAWHVPTAPARSVREVVEDVARLGGRPAAGVWAIPRVLLTAAGTVVPLLRELRETRHQFERPFVLDSTRAQQTFGLAPTPWEDALRATLTALAG